MMHRGEVGRRVVRVAAGAVGVVLVGSWAAPASAAVEVPAPVTQWFATAGPAAVRDAAAGDPELVPGLVPGAGAADVSFGRIVPVVRIDVPGYDLVSGTVSGPTDHAHTATASSTWCARTVVGGTPLDVLTCAVDADGAVSWESTSQVAFLGADDLAAEGLFQQPGLFAVSASQVVALDDRAAADVPEPVGYDEFVGALARRAAQVRAVGDDASSGGAQAPSLFAASDADIAAWDVRVREAVAAHDASDGGALWTVLVGVGVGACLVALAAVLWSRRRRSGVRVAAA